MTGWIDKVRYHLLPCGKVSSFTLSDQTTKEVKSENKYGTIFTNFRIES